ncbi:hypothetical protein AOXY_G33768 [Acipenser oxyrinchus oxyrinchus]|uniref:Uncharacterized protein n=1 Tax=Acipenser oxyrinchus oxyrinchus TaxID=40147 RepID=A0AAD8CFP1_ACIOX|nr:hypothetical protein AOXY_G33768 [Acipenser oxyrinchus oxyrinchus]
MVSCLDATATVVQSSTVTGVNIAQKVGTEDGEVLVPQSDWQSFLKPFFRMMLGIKKYHFRFDAAYHGMVFRKQYSDSEEEMFALLRDDTCRPPADRPQPIRPPGLDCKRKQYLYEKI